MDTTTATTGTTTTTSATNTAAMDTLPSVDSDYQTFLTMMTTQMQNQDPTDPMSSDQMAVELATFSGVEQQTQTNSLMTQLLAATNSQAMSQMAGWVGDQARIDAPVYYDGTPVTLSPNPAVDATKATLVVTDANGVEVDRRDLPAVSSADYTWDGKDSSGTPLPTGVYTLSLESYQDTTLLGSTGVEYYAPVQEIRSSPSGVTILVPGAIEVPSSYVTALRAPTTPS
jgi:flagellar basal-body rod modification protein FlgD